MPRADAERRQPLSDHALKQQDILSVAQGARRIAAPAGEGTAWPPSRHATNRACPGHGQKAARLHEFTHETSESRPSAVSVIEPVTVMPPAMPTRIRVAIFAVAIAASAVGFFTPSGAGDEPADTGAPAVLGTH